jgi:hypothetical protein
MRNHSQKKAAESNRETQSDSCRFKKQVINAGQPFFSLKFRKAEFTSVRCRRSHKAFTSIERL